MTLAETIDSEEVMRFKHKLPFDPAHGYTLNELLNIQAPEEAFDYLNFWQDAYEQAMEVSTRPRVQESQQKLPGYHLYDFEYTSLNQLRLGGWIALPDDEPITRGLIVGHGYGGRSEPDLDFHIPNAAILFLCVRGISRSQIKGIPSQPLKHVLHGIHSRDSYIIKGCVADIWCGTNALIQLIPEATLRLDYVGCSLGGGLGIMAMAHDHRFDKAHVSVPTFGHQPLRLSLPCTGSGLALTRYAEKNPEIIHTLSYFDAAVAARHIKIPIHFANALFDPCVPPPGQFAIYNAVSSPKELHVLKSGHFGHGTWQKENHAMNREIESFFTEE